MISIPPKYSVSKVVGYVKGKSAIHISRTYFGRTENYTGQNGVLNIFSALAQFERRLIQERTRAGLEAARSRGREGGRRPVNPNDPKVLTPKKCTKITA